MTRYGPVFQSRVAVTIRREGSVASYWSNGDLAVTVDRDYSAAAAGLGGAAGGREMWRMFAMYRSGNVAISFESGEAGGFVQVRGQLLAACLCLCPGLSG